jgi:hypothetical protein
MFQTLWKPCILKSFGISLDHLLKEFVDLLLAATEITTFNKVVGLLSPTTSWSVQLEGPQEV